MAEKKTKKAAAPKAEGKATKATKAKAPKAEGKAPKAAAKQEKATKAPKAAKQEKAPKAAEKKPAAKAAPKGKAAAKVATKAAPKGKAPKGKAPKAEGSGHSRQPAFAEDQVITLVATENPKRNRGGARERFDLYKSGMRVAEYLAQGGKRSDLIVDTTKGYITIK